MLIFKKSKHMDSAVGNLSREFVDSLDDIAMSEFQTDKITKEAHKEIKKKNH